MKRRVLDVSELGTLGFGHRDPLWWAVWLLIGIEGTMLVLLAICYFYLKDRISPWPPDLSPRTLAWVATAELAALVLSIVPMAMAGRAAVRGSVPGMRGGLLAATLLGLAAGACRIAIFVLLPFRWDADAYGSVVWALLGTQTVHLITGVGENALFVVLMFVGPVEEKHRVDVHVTTPLWYFVIAGDLLLYLVVFVEIFMKGFST